ncbi:DNA-binding transcriptional regulator, MarR family [Catalinimonas alkaloidigena]|uniref:DNA-binding transcriptional regulator, MarR family n=1 Tax=Catalinimonas alkaloidigena TaxID=1075417 RepID=A0A1G9H4U4_9BACT|nr:MarR family winged helix-turn-helix transcriptional regulator [Catalinimonas alkaloidigena]SDL07902.1 DNA-binding transcriptional regulator, MarR family [Catalinimonas alkaloidigena]
MSSTRPIGYWLKRADQLLTAHADRLQALHRATRLEWQVLNLLYESGPSTAVQVAQTMQPFTDRAGLDTMLARFQDEGWATRDAQARYHLTEVGREQHTRMHTTQQQLRTQTLQGISEEQYATTLRVLEQIVANLEATLE